MTFTTGMKTLHKSDGHAWVTWIASITGINYVGISTSLGTKSRLNPHDTIICLNQFR